MTFYLWEPFKALPVTLHHIKNKRSSKTNRHKKQRIFIGILTLFLNTASPVDAELHYMTPQDA